MKHILLVMATVLANSCFAQINYSYNRIRTGDELIKQQVEYKDPGRSGEDVIWDFGKLNTIDDDYSLTYGSADSETFTIGNDTVIIDKKKEEIIVATEHNTMYYYKQDSSRLSLMGYENPATLVHLKEPSVLLTYPFNLNQSFESTSGGEGNYSDHLRFEVNATSQHRADAYGMMILPSGDTLKHTLRIKTIETIHTQTDKVETSGADSMTIERYKWYTKGYRYPVFETIRTISEKDSAAVQEFSSSFFFPPQDHYYLDNDKENLAVLDSLWNLEKEKGGHILEENNANVVKPVFTYNFYPNPVSTILNIEYYLEEDSWVVISIYSIQGKLLKTVNKGQQYQAMDREAIDCTDLSSGTYIIRFETKSNVVSNKFIKK